MNASYSSSSAAATTTTVVVLLLRHYVEGRSVKMKNKKPALSNFNFSLRSSFNIQYQGMRVGWLVAFIGLN